MYAAADDVGGIRELLGSARALIENTDERICEQEETMKRLVMAMCCAVACSVLLSAAQSGTMDKDKMDKGMKKGTMTVTGCVTQESNGQFMLTNAMMSGDMKGDMKPMSYDLSGGNLKPHIGHKVEVTGTM